MTNARAIARLLDLRRLRERSALNALTQCEGDCRRAEQQVLRHRQVAIVVVGAEGLDQAGIARVLQPAMQRMAGLEDFLGKVGPPYGVDRAAQALTELLPVPATTPVRALRPVPLLPLRRPPEPQTQI